MSQPPEYPGTPADPHGTNPPGYPPPGYGTPPPPGYGAPPPGYGAPPPGYGAPPPPGYGAPPPPGYGAPPPPGYAPPPGYGYPPGYAPSKPPFSVGDAFSWAWTMFTKNAVALIVPALVYGVLLGVASGVTVLGETMGPNTTTPDDFGFGFFFSTNLTGAALIFVIVGSLLSYAATAFAQAGFLSGCLDIADGRPVTIGSFFKPRNFGMAFLAALILGVLTSIGYSLCLVPGLILSLFVQFTILFIVDRSQSAINGLTSSFSLVWSNFANSLLVWLTAMAVTFVGALACGVGLLVAAPVVALILTYTYRKLSGGHVVPLERAGYPPA